MLFLTAAIGLLLFMIMNSRKREAGLLFGGIVGRLVGQLWTGRRRGAMSGAFIVALLDSLSDLVIGLLVGVYPFASRHHGTVAKLLALDRVESRNPAEIWSGWPFQSAAATGYNSGSISRTSAEGLFFGWQ